MSVQPAGMQVSTSASVGSAGEIVALLMVGAVFWMVTGAMHAGWWTGTFVGVFLGNVIGDADRLGLDAVFPAALLAIIGPLLRERPGAIAALVGGGLCLVMIPWAPAGVPIMVSLAGAFVALTVSATGEPA